MATVASTRTAPRWLTYVLYVVMVLLTLMFVMSAFGKLTGAQMNVDNFTRWGYPIWFMYVTGLVELGSVVLMWIPRTRFWGALGLVATMIGAILTHAINAEWFMLPIVGTLLVLAGIVALANRPRRV